MARVYSLLRYAGLIAAILLIYGAADSIHANHFFGGGVKWCTDPHAHNVVVLTWRQLFLTQILEATARNARVSWGDTGVSYTSERELTYIGTITTVDNAQYAVMEVTLTHTYPLPGVYTMRLEGDTRSIRAHNVGGGRWMAEITVQVNGEQYFEAPYYDFFEPDTVANGLITLGNDAVNQSWTLDLTPYLKHVDIKHPVTCSLYTADEVDITGHHLGGGLMQAVTPSVIMSDDGTSVLSVTEDCVISWPYPQDISKEIVSHYSLPIQFTNPWTFASSMVELPMQVSHNFGGTKIPIFSGRQMLEYHN